MELLKPTISDRGIVLDHDMPCSVLWDKEPAVLNGDTGIFYPSRKAQEDGWMLLKVPRWLRWFMRKYAK